MMNIQSDKKAVYIENSSFICLTEFESVFSEHTDAFSAASWTCTLFIETMLQWDLSWQEDGGDHGPRSLLYMQACDYLSTSDYVYISLTKRTIYVFYVVKSVEHKINEMMVHLYCKNSEVWD